MGESKFTPEFIAGQLAICTEQRKQNWLDSRQVRNGGASIVALHAVYGYADALREIWRLQAELKLSEANRECLLTDNRTFRDRVAILEGELAEVNALLDLIDEVADALEAAEERLTGGGGKRGELGRLMLTFFSRPSSPQRRTRLGSTTAL